MRSSGAPSETDYGSGRAGRRTGRRVSSAYHCRVSATPVDPLLLGIDLGTSSVKVLLATARGKAVGRGTAEYPILRTGPDRAEQDPEAWWRAISTATRAAVGTADDLPVGRGASTRIAAIGFSGQMHGTVLLSAAHRVLAPAIIWPDQRSAVEVAALTEELGRERAIRLAGGPLATGFQIATLRWLRAHEPALLDKAAVVLAPKDAIRLRMTGRVASEPSDGSGTGMLDPATRSWAPDLVAASGLDASRLPPILEAAEVAGTLLPAAAEDLGLPAGIPVVTGGADTPVGMVGAGVVTPDALLLTISTGGQLAVPAVTPEVDLTGRSHTFCAALPPESSAGWYRMAASLSAGMALAWLRDAVLGLQGADAYDRMLGWAANAPPGARGLVFLPYLAGERSPHMDPGARGVLMGLTAAHGRNELVRAVVEGITLGCYDASRALEEAGRPPGSIVFAGGGSRSPLWQQILADIFDLPVRRLETSEQAALGACLLAAAGSGLVDPTRAAAEWASCGPVVEPDPARHAAYQEVYGIFRDGYPTLREAFRRLRHLDHS